MDKRIMFEALSKRKGNIEPIPMGTVTGRLIEPRPEIQELPKIRTSGPCPEWVRSRWPESPVDLGTQIHQQIDRMVRHQDHEMVKAVMFGTFNREANFYREVQSAFVEGRDIAGAWEMMRDYCEADVKATQEALNATSKIMAAMEDTLELDLFDLPEEPEYDGDDLMAAVRSFCRQ